MAAMLDEVINLLRITNARFIFGRRDFEDLSIWIYMRSYAKANFYAGDLRDTHEYLKWCHEMIDVTSKRMPEICRVIDYEDMVVDPTRAVKDVAALWDLDVPEDIELPPIGDDRGCADPYLENMHAARAE